MDQRISLITLGVADLARSRRFYEHLGWSSPCPWDSDVVFFQAKGMIFGLWSRDALDRDSCAEPGAHSGGFALAYNVGGPLEVDAVLRDAAAAGGTVKRVGGETFWGGYSGLFHDPDGHPWEVAHNPGWTLAPDGSVSLQSPS